MNLLEQYQKIRKPKSQRWEEGIRAGIDAGVDLSTALAQRGREARSKQQELEEMQGALGLERQQLDQELQSLNDRLLEVDPDNLDAEAAAFYAAEKRSIDKHRAELDEAEGRMPESFTFRNVKRESLPTIGERKDVTPRIGDIKQAQAEKRTEQARIQAEINAKQKAEAEGKWQREFEQEERRIQGAIEGRAAALETRENIAEMQDATKRDLAKARIEANRQKTLARIKAHNDKIRSGELSAGERGTVSDGLTAINTLKKLREFVVANPDQFGIFAGRKAQAESKATGKGAAKDYFNKQLLSVQLAGGFLEGGKLQGEDVPRYQDMLGHLTDDNTQVLSNIDSVIEQVQAKIELIKQVAGAGAANDAPPMLARPNEGNTPQESIQGYSMDDLLQGSPVQ